MSLLPEVNKEAVAEWVAALRSGQYQQAQEELAVEQDGTFAFCCLGVACEVFGERLGLTRVPRDVNAYGYKWTEDGGFDIAYGTLPRPVMKLLGVENDPPLRNGSTSCIDMNDSEDADFRTIADEIEAEYLLEDDDVVA